MCECEKPRQKPAAQNRSNQFIEHIQISSQPFVSVQHAIKSTAYCLNYYSTCSLFRRIIKYAYIFAFDSRLTMTTTATWLQVLPISGHNVTILMLATCSRNMHSSEYELRKHWVWSLESGYSHLDTSRVLCAFSKRIQTKWKSFHSSRASCRWLCAPFIRPLKCPRMDKLFPNYFRRYQLTALSSSFIVFASNILLFFFFSPRAAPKCLFAIQQPLGQT